MKIYIAGKIPGDPDYRAKFADAQRAHLQRILRETLCKKC